MSFSLVFNVSILVGLFCLLLLLWYSLLFLYISFAGQTLQAVSTPSALMVAPNVVNVSWLHSSPAVRSYRVNVGGVSYAQVMDEYVTVVLNDVGEGESVDVTIIPVDICGQVGSPTSVSIVYYSPTGNTYL